ncbi:unnamed protein product, partial [Allacma fusca]
LIGPEICMLLIHAIHTLINGYIISKLARCNKFTLKLALNHFKNKLKQTIINLQMPKYVWRPKILPVEHANFVPPVYRPLPAGIHFKKKDVVHVRTLNWWASNAPPYVDPREGRPHRR